MLDRSQLGARATTPKRNSVPRVVAEAQQRTATLASDRQDADAAALLGVGSMVSILAGKAAIVVMFSQTCLADLLRGWIRGRLANLAERQVLRQPRHSSFASP